MTTIAQGIQEAFDSLRSLGVTPLEVGMTHATWRQIAAEAGVEIASARFDGVQVKVSDDEWAALRINTDARWRYFTGFVRYPGPWKATGELRYLNYLSVEVDGAVDRRVRVLQQCWARGHERDWRNVPVID